MKRTCTYAFAAWLLITSMPLTAAATPKFLLTPQTATTQQIPTNGTGKVVYRVTNQTKITRTLTAVPIQGVEQVTTAGNCSSPFTLGPNESCLLELEILGADVAPGGIQGGPQVCKTQGPGNNSPNLFLCSQPETANILRITPGPATEATLTVTPSTLALSVTGLNTTTGNDSGTPRVFTIENTGPGTATGIECPTSDSASIQSIACNGCDNLANGDSCTVTITPTNIPSAAVENATPTPIILTIAGSNTNTLSPTVNVLTYGSFYQAGWLFSIIETADSSLSIGGTVAAESDNAAQLTTQYSLNGANTTPAMYSGTDGLANTNAMVAQYGAGDYSAKVCTNYAGGGYTDWYLPAICQMGFGGVDANFNCEASPGSIPNMQHNLLVTNPAHNFNFVNNSTYWSSTASEGGAPFSAWVQLFAVGGGEGGRGNFDVDGFFGVRCVRAIT